jgi:hypothetical protein
MCKEMPVILVSKVVDLKRNNRKNNGGPRRRRGKNLAGFEPIILPQGH